MKVVYSELKQEINAKEPILALVRNNHWFLWGMESKSRYFGYWIKNKDRIFKLIDSFEIPGLSIFDEIKKIEILSPYFAKIYFQGCILEILLDSQGLILKSNRPLKIRINLDFKKLYSHQKFGNNYQILPLSNGYFINFFQDNERYNLQSYLFYEGDLKFKNFWKETFDNFDAKRNFSSEKNWIFEAFEGYFTEIKFFCPEKPISLLSYEQNDERIDKKISGFLQKRILSLYDDYFLAGLPWFCEYWFRDELISLWLLDKFYKTNKTLSYIKDKMTNHYLGNLENFSLSNKPYGDNSADILLWILLLADKKQIQKNLIKIKNVLGKWLNLYFQNGKITLIEKATWMDTINRQRAVEIDFLFIKMLEKMSIIENDSLKQFTSEEYSRKLKTNLVTEFYPKDELERPNIFLTYLLEPKFLSYMKWEKLFDNLILKNWRNWGGFSSLPKANSNFHKNHTGELSESYHQGDSWFWLNNISGIAMKNLQSQINVDQNVNKRRKTKYSNYIEKIQSAGLKNLLELGALGWGSELSSASELKSEGSPIQLWSMSSLLKLLD